MKYFSVIGYDCCIFWIKRRGRLFNTRPRIPGVCSGFRVDLNGVFFIIFDSLYL